MVMDAGLKCLGLIAKFHQIPFDESQITHQFSVPNKPFDSVDILRAAKSLTLKAKKVSVKTEDLIKAPFACHSAYAIR
jgi:subfamily B ATP-binding cassette protein HlyB/CyaB